MKHSSYSFSNFFFFPIGLFCSRTWPQAQSWNGWMSPHEETSELLEELQGLGVPQDQRETCCVPNRWYCTGHWQLFSGNKQSIRDAMWAEPRLASLCLILSEVSRRGFTNQDLLRAMWSSQIPQLSAGTLSPCMFISPCYWLPCQVPQGSCLTLLLLLVFLDSSCSFSTTLTISLPPFPMSRFSQSSSLQHNCATISSSPLHPWIPCM